MPGHLRWNPPPLTLDAAESWVLSRAFCGPDPAPRPLGPEEAPRTVQVAGALFLAPRIGGGASPAQLVDELGEGPAEVFRLAHRKAALRAILYEQLCVRVTSVGADAGVPLIFLKGAALHLGGWVRAGLREWSDVDLLAPVADLAKVWGAFLEAGWSPTGLRSEEHHLPVLQGPTGGGIEVHSMLPGVRVSGSRGSATASDILDGGLCSPAPGLPTGSYLPTEPLLMAHLLVHGVGQHGLLPDTYPLTRLLGDVHDIGWGKEAWSAFRHASYGWIARDVSPAEVAAFADLASRLGAGEDPDRIVAAEDPAGTLLRHIVTAARDPAYVRALRGRHYRRPLVARSLPRTVWWKVAGRLALGDRRIRG